ncbi:MULTISPECIES: ABC transporter ATP-binding protein [unclassified Bacillus (in: firmicutes)]|uniref:ABC transporter ATP-binding protein n=1 Tax=unclassified Bacillus (in: firmicutes) TaxID=185979 RepID=UPI0008F06034|nr:MULTISPECIES: ABC transporter ATP-binding protein [unclassified Bacillus (in: firmicutes)]PGZ93272.1 ABC transporter ATP-binding protein [Bacillus sp. AFS029533]SFD22509.1 ABC-2 type transport system ATP-binding protein [Bacillus sp. UNCCL81]
MNRDIVLELKSVNKTISNQKIIRDISFELYKGEVLGLLGPNGSGKTTTMRMIVGLMSITSGEIYIQGNSIKENFKESIKQIGAMIETPAFYPFYSGYKNLMYFARMLDGVSKDRVLEVIDLLGLSNAIHKKFSTYSLGMKQRLGIAQALLHNPSILILDEPTNGLDPAGVREIRDYLKRIAEVEQTAILLSSHLLSEIELICDRSIIIQNGQFVESIDLNDKSGENLFIEIVVKSTKAFESSFTNRDNKYKFDIINDRAIIFEIDEEEIPSLMKDLVLAGIEIYYVTRKKERLEDLFIQLTGGNVIE